MRVSNDTASAGGPPRLRLCLAASGGGHVRQLLDLEPVWLAHDYFFVSEDTALSRSIAERHPTRFVSHFALGQARLGNPLKMMAAALRNCVEAASIISRERPDVVISTGAGAVFWTIVWSRLFGAKIIIVESFARFQAPSVFGRLTAPLAHHKIAQSSALTKYWPDAKIFDPLKIVDTPRPEKEPLLFATVGAILPFDRLMTMVADAKVAGQIPEHVLVQTGVGGLAPKDLEVVETLPFDQMQDVLRRADIVVCHGGTGSLITAMRQGCRVIAVPRLFEKGEVYDDHQREITEAFAARGMIAVANTPDEFSRALEEVRSRPPVMATSDPQDLIGHLRGVLATLTPRKSVRQRTLSTEGSPTLPAPWSRKP